MTDTDDRAQIAALGAHRCGSPRCPQLAEDTIAALRAELARVTRERDVLMATVDRVRAVGSGWEHREDCLASRHEDCGETYGRPDSWCCFGANATEYTTREECIEAQKDECDCGLEALRGMLTASGDPCPWPEVTP